MKYSANDNLEIMKFAKNYNRFLVNNVVLQINNYNCKNILDFGCADGFFIEKISSEIKDLKISGIEVDDLSYEICKEKKISVYRNIGDLESDVDLIYSFNVLEHIEDDEAMLQKLYDRIAQNGILLLYVPALMFLYSSMDKKTGHYRRYSKKDLIDKLKNAGFYIQNAEYCDCLGVLATLLYIVKDKLFKNNNGDISKNSVVIYDYIFPLSRFLDKIILKYFCGKNLMIIARK